MAACVEVSRDQMVQFKVKVKKKRETNKRIKGRFTRGACWESCPVCCFGLSAAAAAKRANAKLTRQPSDESDRSSASLHVLVPDF